MSNEHETRPRIMKDIGGVALPLLGGGVEASVYALDDKHVLRRYKPGAKMSMNTLEKLAHFYRSLNRSVNFAIPDILAIGISDGSYCTVDRRIHGEEFDQTLGRLEGTAREKALLSYIQTAEQIQDLHPKYDFYGEVLADKPLHENDWTTFIRRRLKSDYESAKEIFDNEVPDMQAVFGFIDTEAEIVSDTKASKLIHGDYYVLNVLANESGEVSGVLDFNSSDGLTLAGDPRMNVFASLIYLFEGESNARPEDAQFVLDYLIDKYGENIKRIVHLYRLYYAIHFASYCKDSDPYTFNWSIRSLKEHLNSDYAY